MRQFKEGRTYHVNGGGIITITKRTRCYITFTGDYSGRRRITAIGDRGMFGLGENIMIPVMNGYADTERFCFAGHDTDPEPLTGEDLAIETANKWFFQGVSWWELEEKLNRHPELSEVRETVIGHFDEYYEERWGTRPERTRK